MNKRERTLLALVGGAIGLFIIYNAIQYIFISPIHEANEKIAKYQSEINKSKGVIRSKDSLVRRWTALVGRTLSFDPAEASNRFAKSLKDIAKNHPTITIDSISPTSGLKIGTKTGIETVAYRTVLEGRFSEVLALLLDVYKTPYLCEITRLSFAPITQKGRGRDEVKVELTIETPVPPQIEKKQIPEAATAQVMPTDSDTPLPPVRATIKTPQDFPLLADRLIFRPYVAPPANVIVINNEDWKTVAIRAAFFWDNKLNEEAVDTIPSKTSKTYTKHGDIVEVSGAYADGKAFGPERLDFNTKKDFTY
ncbi:MAG TPA: hypothetical protein VMV81_12880, partial [Phycisphaerae bacterium]|nr:hypothetical protein [Phycisphaerae bacterium]